MASGPSLNEIVSSLSNRVGQPFNVPLQEELKLVVNYKRANYTQQFLEKHPDQRRFFQQTFTVDLEEIDPGDCEIPSVGCKVLRSKCEVPMPIRSSYTLFDFVGTANWLIAYGEIKPEFNIYTKHNRFTKNHPKWAFINKKIYVFNDLAIKKLGMRGIFADPNQVNSCCSTGKCYSDDDAYPITIDILNSIVRDILNTELRSQFPQPGVVSHTENKDTDKPENK